MANGTVVLAAADAPTCIFLSSTSRDLAEHRRAVVRECADSGYALTVMEEFGAQDDDARGVSVAEVAPCDVFVGVYARRYGYVPKGAACSVTEMEHEEAVRLGKPRLLFVVAPDYTAHPLLEQHRDDHDAGAAAGLRRFLERIGQERVWDMFTTPEHLAQRVRFALSKWKGWHAPKPPALPRRFVGRAALLAELAASLDAHDRIWLGGIGGIGKSLAAQHFAHTHADAFPGGTLWVTLGPGASDAETVLRATMREWLRHHHPGRLADPETVASATVRDWLGSVDGRLLVVLDDVWHAAPARDILQLVPGSASVLITSRRGDVARQLGIEAGVEVGSLTTDEALQMLRDRVGDMPSRSGLREVATVLGGHPLALEIAAATIVREGPDHAERLPELLRAEIASTADAEGDAEIPKTVGATLELTYRAMGADLARRYRALGALAPAAPITPFLMAAAWGVDPNGPDALDDALDRMGALARNGVLSRVPGQPIFIEHSLVRAHARRLLVGAAELDDADDRYARGVVALAERKFAAPSQDWREMQPYLPHITYVGDETAAQVRAALGELAPLAAPTAAGEPFAIGADTPRRLLLRALNFAAAVSTVVRERPLGGASAAQWLQAGVVAARALDERHWAAAFLLDLGTWSIRHGDPHAAIEHYEAVTRLPRVAGNARQEADAEQRLALAYIETGRYDEAQALLQSAAAQAGARDDRATMAGVRVAEGTLKRRQGDLQGAIAAYFEALPLVEEDRGQTATVLNNIGLAYRALGQPQQAAGCLEAALAVHRDLGNRREEAVTLDNLAGVAWDAWDLERAERLYGEAREAAREVGDRRQEAKALANLGTVYEKGGDAQRSLSCLEEALPILRELGDVAAQAAALNNLAVARLRADPAGALSLLGESLELNVKLGDRVAQGKVLNVIGDAWYALRDGEQAHKAYRASLDLSRATGDRGTEAQVLQNLGLLQHAMKNHGEAALAYQRSLEIMREIGDRNGEAVNLSNLASIAFTSGDPALARSRLEEALAIMMEIGDRRSAQAIQRNLDELARETASAAPPAPAPASAPETEDENAREVLIAFLHAEGPMRAIHYAKHKAILQSPEVEAMLQRLVDAARASGDAGMVGYGESVLEFLRAMRAVGGER